MYDEHDGPDRVAQSSLRLLGSCRHSIRATVVVSGVTVHSPNHGERLIFPENRLIALKTAFGACAKRRAENERLAPCERLPLRLGAFAWVFSSAPHVSRKGAKAQRRLRLVGHYEPEASATANPPATATVTASTHRDGRIEPASGTPSRCGRSCRT